MVMETKEVTIYENSVGQLGSNGSDSIRVHMGPRARKLNL